MGESSSAKLDDSLFGQTALRNARIRYPRRGERSLSFSRDLPITQAAVEFALRRHEGQHRLADGASFILHPLEVASLLERAHYPDHVVAAAVLHDVLEDTDTQRSELESNFGPDVASLVALVSDDRRSPTRRSARTMSASACAEPAATPRSSMRPTRCRR